MVQISYRDRCFVAIVGNVGTARRVQQQRLVEPMPDLENRREPLVIERQAAHVAVNLQAVGAGLEHPLGLLRRRFRRVQRQGRDITGKMMGILGDDLGQSVIGDARQLGRRFRTGHRFHRHGQREDLRVAVEQLDNA